MQNFGQIKNVFNNLLIEGLVDKNPKGKKLFKEYVKTIKENEILKTQFMVYDNIENKVEVDEAKARLFVETNLSLLSKFTKKQIKEANIKLMLPIQYEKIVPSELDKLYENISYLIMNEKSVKNVDLVVEATSYIIDYIRNNKEKVVTEAIELPTSVLTSVMVDKYNEKYNDLDESEKQILKSLINSDDTTKKDIYTKTIRECIDLIDVKLLESDLDTKDKLLRVKDKLLNDKSEINEDYDKNIAKLFDLRNSLK